jgi:hypothetical protein
MVRMIHEGTVSSSGDESTARRGVYVFFTSAASLLPKRLFILN